MPSIQLTDEQRAAVASAFASVRTALNQSPKFLVAVAMAGGMAVTEAQAWGNQFENLGQTIGREVGRGAVGGGFGAKANVAGLIGQTVGSMVARPVDQAAKERDRMAQIEQQARERAALDAARSAQPGYRQAAQPGYRQAAANAMRANETYNSVGSSITFTNAQGQQISQEQAERSFQRQR